MPHVPNHNPDGSWQSPGPEWEANPFEIGPGPWDVGGWGTFLFTEAIEGAREYMDPSGHQIWVLPEVEVQGKTFVLEEPDSIFGPYGYSPTGEPADLPPTVVIPVVGEPVRTTPESPSPKNETKPGPGGSPDLDQGRVHWYLSPHWR